MYDIMYAAMDTTQVSASACEPQYCVILTVMSCCRLPREGKLY